MGTGTRSNCTKKTAPTCCPWALVLVFLLIEATSKAF